MYKLMQHNVTNSSQVSSAASYFEDLHISYCVPDDIRMLK
jgi:hypothetical protein